MTEDEMVKRLTAKVKGKRQPTMFGLLIGMVARDLIHAWALMLLLGIVAIATGTPGLALGYWVSLGVLGLVGVLRSTRIK